MGGQPLEIRKQKFFEKVHKHHGNKYDLSKVDYKNNHSPITIICDKHGEVNITAGVLAKGGECIKCSYENRAIQNSKFNTIEDLINEMNKTHKNKFKYKVKTPKVKDYITVICPNHGEYQVQAFEHLKGKDCRQCFLESDKPLMKTTQTYINECVEVHGFKYNYDETTYNGIKKPLTIICHEHGKFEQIADTHLSGAGCPKCKSSTGENKILKFLNENEIIFEYQKSFNKLKQKKKLRFDFYIPSLNIVIEFDGKQHFEKVNFSGNFTEEELENNLKNIQQSDKLKNLFCEENNIKIIRIPYWQKDNIESILSSSF